MTAPTGKPIGRPKGRKNNKTLAKEADLALIVKHAEGLMVHEVKGIIDAMVTKAQEGDVQAAKLILDRVLPTRRATDAMNNHGSEIIINIAGIENAQVKPKEFERETGSALIESTDWEVRSTESPREKFS